MCASSSICRSMALAGPRASCLPYQVMKARIAAAYELTPLLVAASAVGRDFAIPGHAGAIGFVTSMTESFCAGCNRLRLTADGAIKSCLFSNGEVALLPALRAGADEKLNWRRFGGTGTGRESPKSTCRWRSCCSSITAVWWRSADERYSLYAMATCGIFPPSPAACAEASPPRGWPSMPATMAKLKAGDLPKGDPLPVARIAALQAAKATSQLIPHCHPLPIDYRRRGVHGGRETASISRSR